MPNEQEPKKPEWKFHRWLQLAEAQASRSVQTPKPKCLHGNPWNECSECAVSQT